MKHRRMWNSPKSTKPVRRIRIVVSPIVSAHHAAVQSGGHPKAFSNAGLHELRRVQSAVS